jgi:hypothetical protein
VAIFVPSIVGWNEITVIDSYPIELIFPIRQGRSPQQVGKKGKDKGRWSVGIKFCWLIMAFEIKWALQKT